MAYNPAKLVNSGLTQAPAQKYVPITKNDTTIFDTCRGLLVGTAGSANLTEHDGTERLLVPLQAGYNPISCKRIKTGGDSDNIWALY